MLLSFEHFCKLFSYSIKKEYVFSEYYFDCVCFINIYNIVTQVY